MHMAVPLVKLPLGKFENRNAKAKEFLIVLPNLPLSTPSKQFGAARKTENESR